MNKILQLDVKWSTDVAGTPFVLFQWEAQRKKCIDEKYVPIKYSIYSHTLLSLYRLCVYSYTNFYFIDKKYSIYWGQLFISCDRVSG